MRTRNNVLMIAILILAIITVYVDLPNSPGLHVGPFQQDFRIRQGLDLQGGLQVLLQADVEEGDLEPGALNVAATIIENRVNALGVVEPLVQTQGEQRIIVELPGIQDPDEAIATIRETGLLEFVDAGTRFLPPTTVVRTTYPLLASEGAETHGTSGEVPEPATGTPTSTLEIEPPSDVVTPAEDVTGDATDTVTGSVPAGEETPPPADERPVVTDQVFATVLTGQHLQTAYVQRDEQTGEFLIGLEMTEAGAQIFQAYTAENINTYLAIVLDKEVISSPVIETAIPEGSAVIRGSFTLESAQQLVIQLRYGSLPVPLSVETTRTVGPTLGQDSVQRSLQAGIVGLAIVLLFMLIYYRLPGLLADLALILYGLLNLAVYKVGWPILLVISLLLIISYLLDRRDIWPLALGAILLVGTVGLAAASFTGVTLTLPAITGFILSTGMAVDANILVFERMKEELRAGRSLGSALEAGFSRAWTSIRDSNISTLITCAILFYFGSTFGAGTVKGFAVTLALGVIINMFTAITVTRTFMRLAFQWAGEKLEESRVLLGA
ncbi:MAG TPA: protein translocase subunit SecD [Anaerolineae bacterium]|nr:protein translocase subunit SecD [Anaerolineae bacterium]